MQQELVDISFQSSVRILRVPKGYLGFIDSGSVAGFQSSVRILRVPKLTYQENLAKATEVSILSEDSSCSKARSRTRSTRR